MYAVPRDGAGCVNVWAGFSHPFPSHGDREGRPDVSTSTMGDPASVYCFLFVVPMTSKYEAGLGWAARVGWGLEKSPLPLIRCIP